MVLVAADSTLAAKVTEGVAVADSTLAAPAEDFAAPMFAVEEPVAVAKVIVVVDSSSVAAFEQVGPNLAVAAGSNHFATEIFVGAVGPPVEHELRGLCGHCGRAARCRELLIRPIPR